MPTRSSVIADRQTLCEHDGCKNIYTFNCSSQTCRKRTCSDCRTSYSLRGPKSLDYCRHCKPIEKSRPLNIITHHSRAAGSTDNWRLPETDYLKKEWSKADVIFLQGVSPETADFILKHLSSTWPDSISRFQMIQSKQTKTAVIYRGDFFEPDNKSSFHGILKDKKVSRNGLSRRLSTFVCTVKPAALHLREIGEKLYFVNVHFPMQNIPDKYSNLFGAVGNFVVKKLDTQVQGNGNGGIDGKRRFSAFICGDFNIKSENLLASAPESFKSNFQLLSPLYAQTDGVFVFPGLPKSKYNLKSKVTTPPFPHDHRVVHVGVSCADCRPSFVLDELFAEGDDRYLKIITHNFGGAGSIDKWDEFAKMHLKEEWSKGDIIFLQEVKSATASAVICSHLNSLQSGSVIFRQYHFENSKTAVIYREDLFEADLNDTFHEIISDREVLKSGLGERLSTFVCTLKPAASHFPEIGKKLYFVNVHFPTKKVRTSNSDLFDVVGNFVVRETGRWALGNGNGGINGMRRFSAFICGDFNNKLKNLSASAPESFKSSFQLLSPLYAPTSKNRTHRCAIDGIFAFLPLQKAEYNLKSKVTTPPFPHDHRVVQVGISCADCRPSIVLDKFAAEGDDLGLENLRIP